MALRSNLFRGDLKLEAAAVRPAAHITRGSRGDHVSKIQYALSVLVGEPLKLDGEYGPKTAAAVLSFKERRKIINKAYQTKPDEIVGVMTLAALDEEMLSIENSGQNSGLITCTFRRTPSTG